MSLDLQKVVESTLRAGDVSRNSTVMDHSAFSGFSREGLRAESFIEALQSYLSKGTLLMPAMSWRNVQPANPLWDEMLTQSQVGVLAEVFRTRYATRRSIHPTHSASGCGAAIDDILGEHEYDSTPCSRQSPYGKLAQYDASILLVGVGLECCTACHCAEEAVAIDVYLRPPNQMEEYLCRDRFGKCRTMRLRRHKPVQRDFPKFEPALEQSGGLVRGKVGAAAWMLVRASALEAVMRSSLLDNRFATLLAGAGVAP